MSVTLHTDLGDIKLELFCDQAPKSCENFLALSASNYYDNTLIHRNIRGFLVQMGDPQGTGKGGTSIWGRKFSDEPHPALKHDRRGTVSMAGAGADSNGSQFFITYACQPSLDGTYGVFGRVIDGEETLAAMERVEVGKKYRPVEEIRLKSVTIHANPLADPSCIQ